MAFRLFDLPRTVLAKWAQVIPQIELVPIQQESISRFLPHWEECHPFPLRFVAT
jgi:hypothetical protein